VKGSDEDRGEIRVVIHDSFSFLLLLHHCSRYYNRSAGFGHGFFEKLVSPNNFRDIGRVIVSFCFIVRHLR
jgi:hypothetical protein